MTENFLQILLYLFQYHVVEGILQQNDRESLVEELDDVGFNPFEARYAIEWLEGFNQAETAVRNCSLTCTYIDTHIYRIMKC